MVTTKLIPGTWDRARHGRLCFDSHAESQPLENARSLVQTTEMDPNVAKYSALDLQSAKHELAIAESAAINHDEASVTQAAYLAGQTARLAQYKASAKADDARVAAGQTEREQIELAARNREVANANMADQQAAAKAAALKAELELLKAKQSR